MNTYYNSSRPNCVECLDGRYVFIFIFISLLNTAVKRPNVRSSSGFSFPFYLNGERSLIAI